MNGSAQGEAATSDVSVIGTGITITGNIEASVDLQIQGKVSGDVRCATLLLGEGSEIRGNVVAERVRVAGLVIGSIQTQDLAIEAQARVKGDVTYARIRIANGGVVDGQMKYTKAEGEPESGSRLRLIDEEAPAPRHAAVYIE
jgi:cytoskeletal protein CcmA (bactofilin family)